MTMYYQTYLCFAFTFTHLGPKRSSLIWNILFLQLAEMVNLHFLSLLEALLECNSTVLSKLLPIWTPVLFSYHMQVWNTPCPSPLLAVQSHIVMMHVHNAVGQVPHFLKWYLYFQVKVWLPAPQHGGYKIPSSQTVQHNVSSAFCKVVCTYEKSMKNYISRCYLAS